MPVKKGVKTKKTPAKKSAKKKSSGKKISKQQRADIKKAVSSLSGLILEQTPITPPLPVHKTPEKIEIPSVRKPIFELPKEKPAPKKIPAYTSSALERKKRMIVNIVVSIIMIFIGTLWVINMGTKFNDAGFKLGSEELLWQTAKEDFSTVVQRPREIKKQMETAVQNEVQKSQEEVIKKILAENLLSASTSTTSTAITVSTTLETATSTLATTSTLE